MSPKPACPSSRFRPEVSTRSSFVHRPASSIEYGATERRRLPSVRGGRFEEGVSNARNPVKLSAVTEPFATNSARASSTWLCNSPDRSTKSAKNEAPCSFKTASTACPAEEPRHWHIFGWRPQLIPQGQIAALKQRDGSGTNRAAGSSHSVDRVSAASVGPKTSVPTDRVHPTKPDRIRPFGPEDLSLPGSGRGFKSLQLFEHTSQPGLPLHAAIRSQMLPLEQKANEVGG